MQALIAKLHIFLAQVDHYIKFWELPFKKNALLKIQSFKLNL